MATKFGLELSEKLNAKLNQNLKNNGKITFF